MLQSVSSTVFVGIINLCFSIFYSTNTLHNQQVSCFTTVQDLFSASLCPSEYADGSTFVHISLAEKEVEHILHINSCCYIMAVFTVFSPAVCLS